MMMKRAKYNLLTIAIAAAVASPAFGADWPMYSGDPSRGAIPVADRVGVRAPVWRLTHDQQNRPIEFFTAAGPVTDGDRVFAVGLIDNAEHLVCVDAATGQVLWTAEAPFVVSDSWSTPAIDAANGVVLFAADRSVVAYDLTDGSVRWEASLQNDIVNASPLITDDRPGENRVFITDYDPFFSQGRLYAINADPFDAATNPYDPGEIVWSAVLGRTSGASPAYADGRVFAATTGLDGIEPGRVFAFDADQPGGTAQPVWVFTNTINRGFFGGVSVADDTDGPAVFAASYAFSGTRFSANLVKLDALDGTLRWSTPSNRTSSVPLALGDGRVLLSTGLAGFGTTPSLQMFEDRGDGAVLLWDSAVETWNDANNNGVIDPGEYTPLGGWTQRPLAVRTDDGLFACVGVISTGGSEVGAYPTMRTVDLGRRPGEAGFFWDTYEGAGNSPAIGGGRVYTVGAQGLVAFDAAARSPFDVNADGVVDLEDLYAWVAGEGDRDVNRDGVVDQRDHDALVAEIRRDEERLMREPQR